MKQLKKNTGASLLMGLAFSMAIFTSASLISAAITQAQKNVRNIEDINIAFYAAEAGIEEALYYNSFHKKGFEAQNEQTADFQVTGYSEIGKDINSGEIIIPNAGYKWDIKSRINTDTPNCPGLSYETTNELCKGELLFGKAIAINFSYDGNTKDNIDTINEVHTNPANTSIKFFHQFDTTALDNSEENLATINWIASYIDLSGVEQKVFANHNKTAPLGNEAADCSNSINLDGKFICRGLLRISNDFTTAFLHFTINNTINTLDEDENNDILTNFFDSSDPNQTWRKLKFFYINLIPGASPTDSSVNSIQYAITPASTDFLTATKTQISAEGRSRNILSNLDVTLDNTEEISALDYGVLLE